jgi:hypothetical protein
LTETRKQIVELGLEISKQFFILGVYNGFPEMPDLNQTNDFEPLRPLITAVRTPLGTVAVL